MRSRLIGVAMIAMLGCAPVVDGPAETQRAVDRGEGDRLAVQLASLPGVVRTDVIVRRPARDPLSRETTVAPATASIVVIVDEQTDKAATVDAVKRLAGAAAPGIEPAIVVEVGATRPVMAKLGPFTVEARSRRPLQIALAIVLALLASISGAVAWRTRPIRRAT